MFVYTTTEEGRSVTPGGATTIEAANSREHRSSRQLGGQGTEGAHREAVVRARVTPFARAVTLLSAFTPSDRWLSHGELAMRTGLPPSTVTRLASSLELLGYLRRQPEARRYRLSAAVLALGHGALASSALRRAQRLQMQAFADAHGIHVNLSSREGLDLSVMESCAASQARLPSFLRAGGRISVTSSPIGSALLAALPQADLDGVMCALENRRPPDWPLLRRRVHIAIAQVREAGYSSASSDFGVGLGVVATPVLLEDQPRVLSCIGPSASFGRVRIACELGPRLLAMAATLPQMRPS
jgi:DNA-binding IclR family transcriptional regulator